MVRQCCLLILAVTLFSFSVATRAFAEDRTAVEARVRADVAHDLASPWQPDSLAARTCLDGRPVADVPGDVVEYWVDLECPYCGIAEPVQAQRRNPDVCIVVRHIPMRDGESMKKALGYEALKKFSVNAANLFWDKVVPKTPQSLPMPYEASLLLAFQEAAIDPDAFGEALGNQAASIVNQDIMDAGNRIPVTPTWVIAGIRFPACDFTAAQFPLALDLAKKARNGDTDALERVITAITNGMMNEPMW
jgi:hypothetical protein